MPAFITERPWPTGSVYRILSTETDDAGLILRAYEKWGTRCPGFLYGDFAFVIFNTQTGEMFGGRDPLGVRPPVLYPSA